MGKHPIPQSGEEGIQKSKLKIKKWPPKMEAVFEFQHLYPHTAI